ncbi:MAG: DUF3883 domain-containing protein [Actinomycetota bacterium]|nr:DUF3883 domain-containing protein [Actinomycetota bacterium]
MPAALAHKEFWVGPFADAVQPRVPLWYILPPNLPLWLVGPAKLVIEGLKVCRVRGGTVFKAEPNEWDAVVVAPGGWPAAAPEVDEARDAIGKFATGRPRGQGIWASAEARRAVERRAMESAAANFRSLGWAVEDVSGRESYDLHCTRRGGAVLRVEVKGTGGTAPRSS